MATAQSKRQAARTERQLQDLLSTVPGNNRCADCGTNNPGWASWSLGVFLCVRCASLHRKLGVHVSKVKSLSMDSWSPEQVDNMKKVGNTRSNTIYNPKNARPDIPIDADEVDGAMERFIRQKYESRSLSTNKPAVKQNTGSTGSGSWNEEPPPLPPKPKKWNFGFRSASSTTSKPPKQEHFTPPLSPTYSTGDDRGPDPPKKDKPSQVFGMKITTVGNNFDQKLAHLRDMGFTDNRRNSEILKAQNGNLDKTVDTLARLGEGSKPAPPPRTLTPVSMGSTGGAGLSIEKTRQEEKKGADNPWEVKQDPPQRSASVPAPQASIPPRSQSADNSWNPFLRDAQPTQPLQSLQSSFQGLSVSQTGYAQPEQPPPVPQIPQQFQNNPFQPQQIQSNPWQQQPNLTQSYAQPSVFSQPQPFQSQSTASLPLQQTGNPFMVPQRSMSASPSNPWSAPLSNPWSSHAPSPPPIAQQPSNPFGPIQNASTWPQPQLQPQSIPQQSFASSPPPLVGQQSYFGPTQQQSQLQSQPTSQLPGEPGQPVQPFGQQPWAQQQQNALPRQQQFSPHQPQQFAQPSFQQPLPPRHDKSSILALYNMPNQIPRQPLQTLQEDPNAMQQSTAPQRSVTMPISQTNANMNPWIPAGPPQTQIPQGARHVRNESVDFVGMGAAPVGGRHSPDAFSGLSARYMR